MDLNLKLNDCQLKNYLFNNNCICWHDKTELYNNIRFYIKNTIEFENSPWSEKSNVIAYYKRIGLSVLQKRIIKYLHENFFKWGSPAYLKMQTLANKLNTTRRSIIKAINRLIERKILIKIHIFSDKYKQCRAILIPHNPFKIKLINKIKSIYTKRSLLQSKRSLLQKNRSDHLISKLPKTLDKNRSIIDYIYSFNILYTQYLISSSKKIYIASQYTKRSTDRFANAKEFNSSERSNKSMTISRYKLKSNSSDASNKLNKAHIDFMALVSSVNFNIFNLSNDQRKNLLNYISSHTYDFEFDKLFSEKKLNSRHPVAQRQHRQLLLDYTRLFFSNEPLNHDITNNILRYWNNIDNPKFQKHKTDKPQSTTYIWLLILTNYMLKFHYENDITKFLNVIERFERYGSQNHYLANTLKKWKLDQLILLRNTNGIKKYFINDKKAFEQELFKYRSKHKDAANRWKQIYVNAFYRDNKKLGLEKYNQWNSKFESFLDLLINRLRECHRELYQRNLTQQKIINGYETDSILADYCDWISYTISKRPNPFDLCNYDYFMQFVFQEMRGVRGMTEFWKPIKT